MKDLSGLRLDTALRTALGAVRDRLMAQFEIDRIVLFGSYIWGKLYDTSDVELLIVLSHDLGLATEDHISQVIRNAQGPSGPLLVEPSGSQP